MRRIYARTRSNAATKTAHNTGLTAQPNADDCGYFTDDPRDYRRVDVGGRAVLPGLSGHRFGEAACC
jgi:hypothetical protein